MKIRTGDNVKIIAGREKGKTGKVMQVFPKENSAVVEKLNVRVRHLRARGSSKGQRVEFSAPISVANIMLVCPKCTAPTRTGYASLADGKKVRVCKKCKEQFA
jgi:large subunit ribosomal protein L24